MATIKELTKSDFNAIKELFYSVFTGPPWFDDWSDEEQLDNYLLDIMEVRNALMYGLYEDDRFIGMTIGRLKHWQGGTEYFVEELCIRNEYQGKGLGTEFMNKVEDELKKKNVHTMILITERSMPAYKFYGKRGFSEVKDSVLLFKDF